MNDVDIVTVLAITLPVLLLFIAVPVAVAFARRHPERRTILKLAPLGLLSFILWGALLAWAASDRRDDAVIAKWIARVRGNGMLPWIVGGLLVLGVGSTALMFV